MEAHMVLTLMAARSRIITFPPKKMRPQIIQFVICEAARVDEVTNGCRETEKTHNRSLVSFQFLKLDYTKCRRLKGR